MMKSIGVSFVSSYIPRQCGIATFTNDLADSVKENFNGNGNSVHITALNDIPEGYKYPSEVRFEIRDKVENDFKEAAYFINLSDSNIVNIQHEFGLYGGEAGSNILYLLENLKKPAVTTLHTILEKPDEDQLKVIEEISGHSSYIVVQSKRGIRMLERIYKVPRDKIKLIPHGAPDVPFIDTTYYKDKLNLAEKKVMLTFGLLGPGKGLEDVINALPDIIRKNPDFVFIILGSTHPNIKRQFGEAYRNQLENLVKKNGVNSNVIFINRFVDKNELIEFLLMSDIYISPYHQKEQIVSGTLSYAAACGKAIISTPYWHAEEILKNERGILIPFKNPDSITKSVNELIKNELKRNRMRKNAYEFGREFIWSEIGKKYTALFQKSISDFKREPDRIYEHSKYKSFPSLPEINNSHLLSLTDTTGIFQHAVCSVPNRNEGYCTDDNVRALMVTLIYKYLTNDPAADRLINTYLSFTHFAYNAETGLFRNFMTYERKWIEERGSESCNGRVIYALGYLIKNPSRNSYQAIANQLFDSSVKNMENFKSPRSIASIIMGCIFYLSGFSGARDINRLCKKLLGRLFEYYTYSSTDGWKWYEDILTYDNARLPMAMLMGGRFYEDRGYINAGLESLEWLFSVLYDSKEGCLSLIGNDGWYKKNNARAKYDQQPVEIPSIIDACFQAYKITEDEVWIERIGIAFSWFLGNNDRHEPLINFATGGCHDGLSSTMINRNQGAESTLSWLLSLQRMYRIRQELQME